MIRAALRFLQSNKALQAVLLSGSLSIATVYLAYNAFEWWHATIPVGIALAFGLIVGRSARDD